MEKIELKDNFIEFDIEGRIFRMDLGHEAMKKRVKEWDDIYESIVSAQGLDDLLILYEKAVSALFGEESFSDIYGLCKENLYVLADLMLKVSNVLKPEKGD